MQDVKSLFESKTFWGVVVTGLSLLLGIWGKDIASDDQTLLIEICSTAAGLVGSAVAVAGRIMASKTIR